MDDQIDAIAALAPNVSRDTIRNAITSSEAKAESPPRLFLILFAVEDEAYVRVVRGSRADVDRLVPLVEFRHSVDAQVIEVGDDFDETPVIEEEYAEVQDA